jgi:hypothetical protein
MIEILDKTTDACVVVRFGGKITGEEYRQFLDAVDERLKVQDEVNMVGDLSEFEFYGDFEAFKEDFHFGTHEYRRVGRAAFVGDQKWIELFMKLVGPLYRAEDKHFPAGQLEDACAWACSEPSA